MSFLNEDLTKEDKAMIIADIVSEAVADYGLKKEPKSDTLAAHLDVYTKDSLLQLAADNNVDVYKSWNKAKLIEAIQTDILDTLEERLLLLGEKKIELILQMDMADEESDMDEIAFYITVFPLAIRLGLIYANDEGEQVTTYVPAEIKAKIQTVLENYPAIADQHAQTIEKWATLETVLTAAVHLYGSFTMERIFELLEIYAPEADLKEFAEQYIPLLVINNVYYNVDGEIIASPRFVSDDHIRDTHNYIADKMDGDYFKPSKEEIAYYAEHSFDRESALYTRMEELVSKASDHAVLAMDLIEMNILMSEPLQSLMDEFNENDLMTFKNENAVMDFAHLYQQLNNTTRLWDNAGYKPSEMSGDTTDFYDEQLKEIVDSVELEEKVEPIRAPQPQVRTRRQPVSNAPQEPIRVEKIGRNEPCPCGSGKKYKKCHWLIDRQ